MRQEVSHNAKMVHYKVMIITFYLSDIMYYVFAAWTIYVPFGRLAQLAMIMCNNSSAHIIQRLELWLALHRDTRKESRNVKLLGPYWGLVCAIFNKVFTNAYERWYSKHNPCIPSADSVQQDVRSCAKWILVDLGMNTNFLLIAHTATDSNVSVGMQGVYRFACLLYLCLE